MITLKKLKLEVVFSEYFNENVLCYSLHFKLAACFKKYFMKYTVQLQ